MDRLTNKVALSLYGRAVSGVALLAKDWDIGFVPRLALTAVLSAERYLICQAAH
jgi:hypothetical protein